MIKLKLVAYDRQEVVYSLYGLTITGVNSAGEWMFYFPEMNYHNVIKSRFKSEYVMEKYIIPMYGEDIPTFCKKTAKKELEKELTRLLQDDLNKKVLIMSLMEGLLVIDR